MAKLGVSKESLERKRITGGMYEVMMTGFKPDRPKSDPTSTDKVNLNPQLKIINHPDHTGKPVFLPLPLSQAWIIQDFVHCFGQELDADGNLPGEWEFPKNADGTPNLASDPKTWKYRGPIVGKTGQVELVEGEFNNKPTLKIKMFICSVPKCKEKNPTITHSTSLN